MGVVVVGAAALMGTFFDQIQDAIEAIGADIIIAAGDVDFGGGGGEEATE